MDPKKPRSRIPLAFGGAFLGSLLCVLVPASWGVKILIAGICFFTVLIGGIVILNRRDRIEKAGNINGVR